MPEFSLNELANNAGSSAANTGINLAKQAKGLACGLYKNYTGFATTFGLGTAPPAAFVKGVWDTVCQDDPGGLPPASAPPFTGGQCVCERYRVNLDWRVVGYPNTPQGNTLDFFGPIGGIRIVPDTALGDVIEVNAGAANGGTCLNYSVWHGVYATGPNTGSKLTNAKITSVTSLSPTPGNCGNPPPTPPPYVAPPPAAITKNVTINYNDNSDFSIPLTYVQMNNDLDIIVDVGGTAFNFNVDKVSFDWNFGPDGQPNSPPGGGGGSGGPGSGGGSNSSNTNINNKLDILTNKINIDVAPKIDNIDVDIDIIKDKVNEPEDCCPEPPDPDKYTKVSLSSQQSATVDGIPGLTWIELHVTQFTKQEKIQYGDNSPNVLYAGWLEFRRDGNCFDRQPIQFTDCIFQAPTGANGYAYCITYAGKARVDYYKKI